MGEGEGGVLTIGIHMYTTDKCTLKSHGLIFGEALFQGKNKELHELISGEAYKRGENYFGCFTFLLVMLSVAKREALYKVAVLNLSNVNAVVWE